MGKCRYQFHAAHARSQGGGEDEDEAGGHGGRATGDRGEARHHRLGGGTGKLKVGSEFLISLSRTGPIGYSGSAGKLKNRVGEDTLKSIFGKILKIHLPSIWKIQ